MQRRSFNDKNKNEENVNGNNLPETEEEIEEDLNDITPEIEELTIFPVKQDDVIHKNFRDFYIRELTTHFGNELDYLRQVRSLDLDCNNTY
jgi:activator of HSP90 ATPase